MKKLHLLLVFLCASVFVNAQSYRGSDADRMNAQRYQQYSQQNSGSNTYQRNYGSGSYGGNSYGSGSYNRSYGNSYNNNSYNNYNRSYSNRYGNNSYNSNQYGSETVIQGAFNNNGQTALCMLRYSGGKITAYAVSKTYTGQYDWQTMYPDNPHPTNSYTDGNWARSYSHKVSVGGTNVYFNLNTGGSYGGGGYGGGSSESLLQGVFIYNGQQNLVILRYSGGKVTHYAVSKDAMGNYDWQTMYPDNPHSTNSIQDGSMASAYRYKVSVQGTTIYFNMQ